MKATKKITIATIITVIIITLCGVAMTAHAENSETFNLLGVVTAWQDHEDCTEYTVTVGNGTMLAFYADKGDFRIGDMVYLTVWDEIQQEVIDVEWIATLEWDEIMNWLKRIEKF